MIRQLIHSTHERLSPALAFPWAALAARGFGFALLWWVLTGGRLDAAWLGGIGILMATWASLKLVPPSRGLNALPFLRFLAFFFWNSACGGFQVALLALRPRTSLDPVMLTFHLDLPPGAPRILMVNVISLMPGTLGVGLDDTKLRLHVLDAKLPVADSVRALEARIMHLFGVAS